MLKNSLKSAKQAISNNDPEEILHHTSAALSIDPNCYLAHIFAGKAHLLAHNLPQAIRSFDAATQIDSANVLGWKALLQAYKAVPDYERSFQVLVELLRAMEGNEGTAEPIKEFKNWMEQSNYRKNDALYMTYLKWTCPRSPLIELVGPRSAFGNPVDNLKELLDKRVKEMETYVAQKAAKERIKYPKVLSGASQSKMDAFKWTCYQEFADVEGLYGEYLEWCEGATSIEYEEKYIQHVYTLMQCAPEKGPLGDKLKEMVGDAVEFKKAIGLAWRLHFEWADPKNLQDLRSDQVYFYIRTFPQDILAFVLRAFCLCELSPYEKSEVDEQLAGIKMGRRRNWEKRKKRKERKKANKKNDAGSDPVDVVSDASDSVSADDSDASTSSLDAVVEAEPVGQYIFSMMEGFRKDPESILITRIACEYLVHLREYGQAEAVCKQGVKTLAELRRRTGMTLAHTQESFLCGLATVYTYLEAPKSHGAAMELYERILRDNPRNTRAQVGSGLIYMEKGELDKAKQVLERVKDVDREAAMEYGWCLVCMGRFQEGREIMEGCLGMYGGDAYGMEGRGRAYYRIGKAYYNESERNKETDSQKVETFETESPTSSREKWIEMAFQNLLLSLKQNSLYSPPYTLLGLIFHRHYHDAAKAQKCFSRAFELDASEVTAAEYLVAELTAQNEWSVADILCTRVLSSEPARRQLRRDENAWPYRVLGCSALNRQDDAKAVEWFQNALRVDSGDRACWMGLGEAYLHVGRLDAAIKVFSHVQTQSTSDWVLEYMLGSALCQTGEFEEGLGHLHAALAQRTELCVYAALYESYTEYAYRLVAGGFFGRATECAARAIEYLGKVEGSPGMWKVLGEAIRVFVVVGERKDEFPWERVEEIFKRGSEGGNGEGAYKDLFSSLLEKLFGVKELHISSLDMLVILSSLCGIAYLPQNAHKYVVSAAYYNAGLSFLQAKQHELSVTALKKAVSLEDANAQFWTALGCSYSPSSPHLAQHCFIRAMALDSRDATIWTNLACLYLRHGDVELAQQAFLRAQSVAPSQSQSWLGNAMAAKVCGDDATAERLFEHAFVLSNGRSPLAQLLYGLSVSEQAVGGSPRDVDTAQRLGVANFAMMQYLKYAPEDIGGLQVALTVAERCKDWRRGVMVGEKLVNLLESSQSDNSSPFEQSEKGKDENEKVALPSGEHSEPFSLRSKGSGLLSAKSQLSRIHLGLGNYDKVVQLSEEILDAQTEPFVLSARISLGLAHFFSSRFSLALEQLKQILAAHSESKTLVSLVAQILYAEGSEECRSAAVESLFDHIENHGSSLAVVLTLGAISVVDNNEEFLVAIKEELDGLDLAELVADRFRTVPRLLATIDERLGEHERLWERSALMFPSDFGVWRRLNREMAVAVGDLRDRKVNADELGRVWMEGDERERRRGMLIAPWVNEIQTSEG